MATKKTLFFERQSGPFGRGLDRWHLVSEKDSTLSVEHSWSRPPATVDGRADVGSRVISAGWFFATVEDDQLQRALRQAITTVINAEMEIQFAAGGLVPVCPPVFDPLATVVEWLATCRVRDLDRLIAFYDTAATLDCACTGQNLCTGTDELRTYWQKRLADLSPSIFILQDIWPTTDATVLDYLSHGGQPVRSFFYFADNGLVKHMRCGPIELAKAS